jgi:hypothetical protein
MVLRYLYLLIIVERYEFNFDPIFKMLCQACKNIFRGNFYSLHNCSAYLATLDRAGHFLRDNAFRPPPNPNYRAHQLDVSSLYQSALKECWICAQIFEDVCKKYMEEDLCPQDSTLAEIARLILQATTGTEKTEGLSGNFTVYELKVDRDDITLCISVDHRPSPWGDRYRYSLAHLRGMLTNAA